MALSIAVGIFASNKGRTGFGWFLISVVASPLIAFVFVLALSNVAEEDKLLELQRTHVKCPDCAELVKAEAKVCKHCGCRLVPRS